MTTARLVRVPPMERGLTLGDFLIPIRLGERASSWQRDLLLVVAGALLITAGAYVSIPVPDLQLGSVYVPINDYVPLTLQTFGVLFSAALLGARRGMSASAFYLLLGIAGLPVFAAGADGVHGSGLGHIVSLRDGGLVLGARGGYLVGFVLAAGLVGRLAELGWDRRLRSSVVALLVGSLVIYLVGVPWLAVAARLEAGDALTFGLFPFLPGDLVKLLVAAGLLPIGWRLVARQPHDR